MLLIFPDGRVSSASPLTDTCFLFGSDSETRQLTLFFHLIGGMKDFLSGGDSGLIRMKVALKVLGALDKVETSLISRTEQKGAD